MRRMLKSLDGFFKRIQQDHVSAYAAQGAYFILLSFIPCLLLLVTLVRYTPITQEMILEGIFQFVPENGGIRDLIAGIVQEVYTKSAAVVPISAVFTLWSAGKGIQALTNGLNSIYHVRETRFYLFNRLRSAFYTLMLLLALVSTLILLVFGNSIQRKLEVHIPVIARLTSMVISMRTGIALVVLAIFFLVLYKVVPNRKASFKSQIPGAVISAVAWSLFSLGFSFYLDYFDGMSNMYGSLTTIMLVMLWMYFCMCIVLIGAEINAYFEDKFPRLQQTAVEKIQSEYKELMEKVREND